MNDKKMIDPTDGPGADKVNTGKIIDLLLRFAQMALDPPSSEEVEEEGYYIGEDAPVRKDDADDVEEGGNEEDLWHEFYMEMEGATCGT